MKTRPILFSAPMVRAILDGSKTQTRRIVKPQSAILTPQMCANMGVRPLPEKSAPVIDCKYGQPGDQLWVKETHRAVFSEAFDEPHLQYRADMSFRMPNSDVEHNQFAGILDDQFGEIIADSKRKWRPSIFTHRWASRITLEITNVRVERLNDITRQDAIAEGVTETEDDTVWLSPEANYCALWESINGPGSWTVNPWVWVIEFTRI